MSSRVRSRQAAAWACGSLFALISFTAVHADDDEAGLPPNSEPPVPFVTNVPTAVEAETDSIVQLSPNGENDNRVGAILAAHPDRDVLICLAGCGGGGPKIVTVRQHARVVAANAGATTITVKARDMSATREMKPSSADLPTLDKPASPQAHPHPGSEPAVGDVICLAGCAGAPGEVVQEAIRLTWIDKATNEELRNALRAVAERLTTQDTAGAALVTRGASDSRHTWMSDHARRMLVDEPLPSVLAALVRSATAMVDRSPPPSR